MIFRDTKRRTDKVEARFQTALNLIKDLDKPEFKRFMAGLDLAWQGYDKIRQVQTRDEKENKDIDSVETFIELTEKEH